MSTMPRTASSSSSRVTCSSTAATASSWSAVVSRLTTISSGRGRTGCTQPDRGDDLAVDLRSVPAVAGQRRRRAERVEQHDLAGAQGLAVLGDDGGQLDQTVDRVVPCRPRRRAPRPRRRAARAPTTGLATRAATAPGRAPPGRAGVVGDDVGRRGLVGRDPQVGDLQRSADGPDGLTDRLRRACTGPAGPAPAAPTSAHRDPRLHEVTARDAAPRRARPSCRRACPRRRTGRRASASSRQVLRPHDDALPR